MLKIGHVLLLEDVNQKEGDTYKCKVVDLDADTIWIDLPKSMIIERTKLLKTSTKLTAQVITEENNVYLFHTEVLGKANKEIPMLCLHNPGKEEMKKIQRRQFVRIETAIDLSFYFPQSQLRFASISKNFSAGGCAVLLPDGILLKEEEVGEGIFVLPMQDGSYHYLQLPFVVKRIWKKDNLTFASVQFSDVGEYDERHITRFCFERQLAFRKKGLLKK